MDFSDTVPAGTKAVRVVMHKADAQSHMFWRKSGDSNISNTPNASSEWTHRLYNSAAYEVNCSKQVVLWLSSDYKVQISSSATGTDLYVSYPLGYLS